MTDIADALKGITQIVDGLRENTPSLSPSQRQALLAARNHLADVSRSAELAASQLTAVLGDADGETEDTDHSTCTPGDCPFGTLEAGERWVFTRADDHRGLEYAGRVVRIGGIGGGELTMVDAVSGHMDGYPYGSDISFYTLVRRIES